MILLKFDNVPFEQDIRELFMAFFPEEKYEHEFPQNLNLREISSMKIPAQGLDYKYVIWAVEDLGDKKEEVYKFTIYGGKYIFDLEIPKNNSRAFLKSEIKKSVYKFLKEETKKSLPWGTLTGIRPSKIIMEMLEKGQSIEKIKDNMKKTYLISDEKLDLCLGVAIKEKNILSKIDYENGFSLYIGIPFCPTTCAYCSFTSYPIGAWKNKTANYIDCLIRELKEVAILTEDKKLQTIYMGGGTPSSLSDKELDTILLAIEESFDLSNLLEFSVEAGRPDSITREKLEVLKKYKIDRISINPQTMSDKTLKLIGRRQTVEEFISSFYMARELGFKNINTDIILGLPEEELKDVAYTMEELKKLSPESITVHTLAIKRAAKLNTNKEEYYGMKIKNNSEMIDLTAVSCKSMGLEPYYMYRQKNMIGNFENVGYAKVGTECIYNILIMEEKQTIIACGAGTSTKLVYPKENRVERLENVKDPKLYIERINEIIDKKIKVIETYNQGR